MISESKIELQEYNIKLRNFYERGEVLSEFYIDVILIGCDKRKDI